MHDQCVWILQDMAFFSRKWLQCSFQVISLNLFKNTLKLRDRHKIRPHNYFFLLDCSDLCSPLEWPGGLPNCPQWRRIWFMHGLIHSSAWQDFFYLSTEVPKPEMFHSSGPLYASSLSLQPSSEHVLIIRMSCCTLRERCQRQQGRPGGSLCATEPPYVMCCGLAFTLWAFLTQN